MATIGAVLGIIRASQPTLHIAMERVAFAIHATFLAVGYSIVVVGATANADAYGKVKFFDTTKMLYSVMLKWHIYLHISYIFICYKCYGS